jgi:ferredoxin
MAASKDSGDLEATGNPTGADITGLIKNKALELGFIEVGITAYDYRYTYQSRRDWVKYEHAICLGYEQDYEPTQTIPSVAAEIVHSSTYRTEQHAALELGSFIRSLGYHAQIHSPTDASAAYIPMFVAAGVGQLGACGYLLTPHAGNRQRILVITTDAKVAYDKPVDYGIHAFCQVCQVCVNRCPGRALMRDKVWWRGVEKNKLYFKRCRPVMARYMGCGICMKVCPVQKYGMATVLAHYAETGQVLGKGTHDLEGYLLPDKGYFGPGEMPVFDGSFFDMPHGRSEDWALEKLKHHYASAGNELTDEMMEEFKKDLAKALTADSGPVMAMEQDYI